MNREQFYEQLAGRYTPDLPINVDAVTNATCLTMLVRDPRNSSWQRAKCTPVVIRSFEPHSGDSTFWHQNHLNFEKEHPKGG
ncbi:hypothetical protein TNCV_906741 [Trichonephila clavipes]|nr:hypothetical protein TNCV_906741 [Trichonephila clavipes]